MKHSFVKWSSWLSAGLMMALMFGCSGGGSSSDDEPDTTPPIITLLGDNPLEVSYAAEFIDPGATATDNLDGSVAVVASGEVDTSTVASYNIEYFAIDAAGNLASTTRVVNVIPARASNLSCVPPDLTGGTPGDVSIQASFPNLPILDSPLAMVQPSSDSSFWFIALREGRVVTIDNNSAANQLNEVLNISSKVTTTLEKGLTGLAVHPDYPQDNRVFLVYNDANQSGRSTVSSFSVNTSSHVIDANSENVLFTLPQPAHNHNGGDIAFGPDNMLYVAFGDGGADRQTSQQLFNLHGAVVRLDVSTANYQIPNDNPFNSGQARCTSGERAQGDTTACPEIYAYGFRNPWRWSFDRQTGELWVADVGESTFEEVDRVISGGNYGWPVMEGNICSDGQNCDPSNYQLPITQYPRSVGVSTVGGYVYRGSRWPSLQGQYIWGDTFSSQFLSVPADSDVGADYTAIFNSSRLIAAMAEGNDGEIYLLNLNGGEGDGVYSLNVEDDGSGVLVMPENLSEVGCFNTETKLHSSGVFDYQLNSALWSDGANKERAFAIPNNQLIEVLEDGDFDFPDNSILLKHFLNGDTYLETRLLIKLADGWRGFSYEWNDQQTDAVLLSQGKIKDVGDFVHTYPSSRECDVCHTSAANHSLGLETAQINLRRTDLGINQLDFLSQAGYLDQQLNSQNQAQLYALDDESATLEERSRSYLHSNCSGCHRAGAALDFIDLNYRTAFAETNTCDVEPSIGDLGIENARIIAPSNADASVLLLRMERLDQHRMPPLASLIVDQMATSLIRDWINGRSDCN
jgi:uncharacterized repeat protein (TIGR03806 family)